MSELELLTPDIDYTDEQIESAQQFLLLLEEVNTRKEFSKINFYEPWGNQIEFHKAGLSHWERLLMGGNQSGKSVASACEDVIHATGCYDDLAFPWEGKRFSHPTDILVIGSSRDQMRGAIQEKLIGKRLNQGTGYLPKESIQNVTWMKDNNDSVDQVYVSWQGKKDKTSTITLKTQSQGQEAIMGTPYHIVNFDEFPLATEMYYQAIARLTATNGLLYTSATPEEGLVDVALRFTSDKENLRWYAYLNTAESPYVLDEVKAELRNRYPPNLYKLKVEGQPFDIGGMVYPFNRVDILCTPFDIIKNRSLKFLAGIDLGFQNSYTAIVWFCFDTLSKTAYIFDCECVRREKPEDVYRLINKWNTPLGLDIPVAWPKDALHSERSSGAVIRDIYKNLGVNMLEDYARFSDARQNYIDPSNWAVYEAFTTGRLKIFNTPATKFLIDEIEQYHKGKDGQIKKTKDAQFDLVDAMRYGHTMILEGYAKAPNNPFAIRVPQKITIKKTRYNLN